MPDPFASRHVACVAEAAEGHVCCSTHIDRRERCVQSPMDARGSEAEAAPAGAGPFASHVVVWCVLHVC